MQVAALILPVFAVIVTGWAAGYVGYVSRDLADGLIHFAYNVAMPALLLWALHRTGYDRSGWALQCAIALPLFIAARFTAPATNINYAFIDPFIHRQWGPAPIHVLISWLFMASVVYLPTHLLLRRLFPARQARAS